MDLSRRDLIKAGAIALFGTWLPLKEVRPLTLPTDGFVGLVEDYTRKNAAPAGPRSPIVYAGARAVRIPTRYALAGGFRFLGQFTKSAAAVISLNSGFPNLTDVDNALGCEQTAAASNWYAAFAVADDDLSAGRVVLMPFFRVASVAGSVVTLGQAGEGILTPSARIYDMTDDVLKGADMLVISELSGSWNHAFSGRVAMITANTNGTVTLDSVGTIEAGDFMLPAPPGVKHYGYLGSFYVDTAEVRNIVDSGQVAKTRGIDVSGYSLNGALGSSGVEVFLAGYISPLASGAILQVNQAFSTASTGDFLFTVGMDSSHDYQAVYDRKDSGGSISLTFSGIEAPFGFKGQQITVKSGGALEGSATRKLQVRGWVEL